MLPYCPEHTLKYSGKTKIEGLKARLSADGVFHNIVVYSPKPLSVKKQRKITGDVYQWLSAELGEGKAVYLLSQVLFSSDEGEYSSFPELANTLKQTYTERYGEEQFPPALAYSVDAEAAKTALPFREHVVEGGTGCGAMSFLDTESLKEKPWWLSVVSYAYLYIPRALDMPDNPADVVGWYLSNGESIPEPLRDPDDTLVAGLGIGIATCGEHGFIFETMVASEKKFFRTLRILAPVLKEYRAKVVMVNEEGVMAYDCGYEFTPVESGNGEIV